MYELARHLLEGSPLALPWLDGWLARDKEQINKREWQLQPALLVQGSVF